MYHSPRLSGNCYLSLMHLRVFCFGRLREILASEIVAELPSPATVADLWSILRQQYPELAAYDGAVAIAVNQSFAALSTALEPGDEIALLPPVSGGHDEPVLPLASVHARLQREPINSTELLARIKAGEDGAVCLFDGVVRNHTRNRRALYLEYDSYPAMALVEMERLATEALACFPIREVRIAHRVGRLPSWREQRPYRGGQRSSRGSLRRLPLGHRFAEEIRTNMEKGIL